MGLRVKARGSLDRRQIVRHTLKVALRLILLHPDGFEEQDLSPHVDMHDGYFPVARCHVGLLNSKIATRIEMSEQSTAEFDFFGKVTFDSG